MRDFSAISSPGGLYQKRLTLFERNQQLFWINSHVMDITGFPLISIAGNTELPSVLKKRRLWDWMPDDMTQRIKRRTEWVGLPNKRIGVHSLPFVLPSWYSQRRSPVSYAGKRK